MLLGIALATQAAFAASDPPHDLLAHGADGRLWVAQVAKSPDTGRPVTTLLGRSIGEKTSWRRYGDLQARVVALSNRGSDLIVLLESGEWTLLWPSEGAIQSATGLPLPQGKIIQLASDANTLWAIARVPGGLAAFPSPATHPATTPAPSSIAAAAPAPSITPPSTRTITPAAAPATPSPGASTQPASRLVLLSLNFNQWQWVPRAQLPDWFQSAPATTSATSPAGLSSSPPDISMVVWKGLPILAMQREQGVVELISCTAGGAWSSPIRITPGFSIETFTLLLGNEQTPKPFLWLAPADAAGALYTSSDATVWTGPTPLVLPSTTKEIGNERALTEAAERLRLIYLAGQPPQRYEQQFDLSGQPVGTPAAIAVPGDTVQRVEWWVETAVMVALVFAMIAAMRRRRLAAENPAKPVDLPLAPTGLRLGAGIIDAIPILVGLAIFAVDYDRQHPAAPNPFLEWVGLISFFTYLAHTTICELATGRTIGKLLFGLKVVTAEGARPSAGAIVARNLLRIIDLWLMGLPLLLVFYSPLRQRVGDIAAGTVVVMRTPADAEEPAGEEPLEEPESDKSVAAAPPPKDDRRG